MSALQASSLHKSKSKSRLAKPKNRNPITGRFEPRKPEAFSQSSDEIILQANNIPTSMTGSRKPTLRSRILKEISSGLLPNAQKSRSCLQKEEGRLTRSKQLSKKKAKDLILERSISAESKSSTEQTKIQRVDGTNSRQKVNAKRKLSISQDNVALESEIVKKTISVSDATITRFLNKIELQETTENMKQGLFNAENDDHTTDKTQASENQDDNCDLGITIICEIKTCEDCKKYIPHQDINDGHKKQCRKCLLHEIFTFHEKNPHIQESDEEESQKQEREASSSKFMTASYGDQVQIGPDHQADIPQCKEKKPKQKVITRTLKSVWNPSKISVDDFKAFNDFLKQKKLYLSEEDITKIITQKNYSLHRSRILCNLQNPEFQPFYERSLANRRKLSN